MQVRPAGNGKRAVARPAHKRIAESSANRDLSAPGSATLPGTTPLGGAEQTISPGAAALFRKFVLSLQCFHETLFRKTGVPGFDSRQSLIVSTPSAVWRLVNPDARFTNGNNSYALAA